MIDINSFNKLINNTKNYFNSIEEVEDNLVLIFDNLEKNNIYVKKINYLSKKYKENDLIKLDCQEILFIEKSFEGEYLDYLNFIIPRITKLNQNHLNKILDDNDYKSESSEESKSEISNEDYINILEVNLNNLQEKLQNVCDDLIPRINYLEEQNMNILKKIESHEKFTKNSFEILEDRFSKIFEVFGKIKL